ncbi:MAG TPA: uroporphyrinogen-III synthase [Candidatus Acidoferrum sp.]
MAEFVASSLAGKRIVVTREVSQSTKLVEELGRRGAIPILFPLIAFEKPDDCVPMNVAMAEMEKFDWIIFTSENAVRAVAEWPGRTESFSGGESRDSVRVAAVGAATRDEAEKAGFRVDYLATEKSGAGLAQEIGRVLKGRRVFLPRSNRANPDLPAALREHGALLTEVTVYKTVRPANASREGLEGIFLSVVDAVLFFSPSAVHNFAEIGGRERIAGLQKDIAVAAIGSTTADAVRELGIETILQPEEPTIEAMMRTLEMYFADLAEVNVQVQPR